MVVGKTHLPLFAPPAGSPAGSTRGFCAEFFEARPARESQGGILGMMLLTETNLAYCQDFMEDMRRAIAAGSFTDFFEGRKNRLAETGGSLTRDQQGVLGFF